MRRQRVTGAAARRLAAGLSDRDLAILADVARVRVLTGRQLERLHFAELTGMHRDRTRRQVLARLVAVQVLATLERRIGGVRAGSSGLVFAPGVAGQRLLALEAGGTAGRRSRRPATPTDRFLEHTLAGAELYVQLVDTARSGSLTVVSYRGEPYSWWRDSEDEWVKPDGYAVVEAGEVEDAWVIEVDMGSESDTTLRRQLRVYVDLANAGERGPRGTVLPRVLVAVTKNSRYLPTEAAVLQRISLVRAIIDSLPAPADQLIHTTSHDRAVPFIAQVLRG